MRATLSTPVLLLALIGALPVWLFAALATIRSGGEHPRMLDPEGARACEDPFDLVDLAVADAGTVLAHDLTRGRHERAGACLGEILSHRTRGIGEGPVDDPLPYTADLGLSGPVRAGPPQRVAGGDW